MMKFLFISIIVVLFSTISVAQEADRVMPVLLKSGSSSGMKIDLKSIYPLKSAKSIEATGDTLLYQTFESYTGDNSNWLPAGWSKQTKNKGIGKTWYMLKPPINWEGNKYLPLVDADFNNESEEYLITPSLTLGNSNDLIFYLVSKPCEMYKKNNDNTYDRNVVTATMLVKVMVDNGSWETIFDASKDPYYTESEFTTMGYRLMRVKLNKYASKNVKIAFVYVGKAGGDMGIDNVFVGNIYPMAWYLRPQGTYYMGLRADGNILPGYFVPAYQNLQFENVSLDSESFKWEGLYKNGYEYLNANGYSPVFSVSTTPAYLPLLEAKLDAKTNSFQYEFNGSSNLKAGHYSSVMNVDLNLGIKTWKYIDGVNFYFGNCNYDGSTPDKSYSYEAVGNHFDKPAQPSVVDSVDVFFGTIEGPANTPLILEVLRVSEDGTQLSVVATATNTISNAKTLSSTIKTLSFKLNNTLYINYKTVYMIRGFNVPGVNVGIMSNSYPDPDESNAFVLLKYADGQTSFVNASNLHNNYLYSLMIVPYMAFPVLHPDKSQINCNKTAGTDKVTLEVTYTPNDMRFAIDNSWVKIDNYSFDQSFTVNPSSFLLTLNISYEALPAEQQGRKTQLYISQKGTEDAIITLVQGTPSALDDVKISPLKVNNVNGAFELNYGLQFKTVEIYNVSGQKLMQITLPAGENHTVNNSQLPSGAYILKFTGSNGSQTVKVMK